MALPQEVIDSINDQLERFGDDGVAFDRWMGTVIPHVRAHADVGAFRTQARALWLSNNKRGVKQLVRDTLSQYTLDERRAAGEKELVGKAFDDAYLTFLKRMGIHKGDTLTVHGTDGSIHSLRFELEGLPSRSPALLTEPAPNPPLGALPPPHLAHEVGMTVQEIEDSRATVDEGNTDDDA